MYFFHSRYDKWCLGWGLMCLEMLAEWADLLEDGRDLGDKCKRPNKCAQAFLYKQRCRGTSRHWCLPPSPTLLGRPYPPASTPTGPWLPLSEANGLPRSPPVFCQSWLCIANASLLADQPCNALMGSTAPPGPQAPGLKSGPQLLAWAPLLAREIGFLNINHCLVF